MKADDPKLEALLESVAGGEDVDWHSAEAGAESDEERSRLEALRGVEQVARFHRSLQRDVAQAAARGVRDIERWGPLLLLELVGSGSSGDVYRAWDPALQREVALKLLRPRESARDASSGAWLEEARALARVRDPHVVAVYGAAEHDGRQGIWMEFLRGRTLAAEIATRGPLPAFEVARLGAQLGRALSAVHAAGAMHRDVKPANVVIEADGRAVLTDFGLGHRSAPGPHTGAFTGTPLFMSPQRLAGASARPTDDLYALGLTLWCALAGKEPFGATTLDELRSAVGADLGRSLRRERPDAPESLVAVIQRAARPDPAERYESASALVQALEETEAPKPAKAVHPAIVVLTALGAIALIIWLTLVSRRGPHTQAPAPVVTAPAPSAAYDIGASFVRRDAAGDVPLATGDRVSPGDRLSLEVRATRPVWVYVLNADERGETYLLYPQPLFDRRNPLPADSTVRLPGARSGRESAWTVTSSGGREHMLVVVNPEPLPDLEAELANLPKASPERAVTYARVSARTMDRLRGIGGVSDAPVAGAVRSTPALLFERIRSLAESEHDVRGTWVRQIVLDNPAR